MYTGCRSPENLKRIYGGKVILEKTNGVKVPS